MQTNNTDGGNLTHLYKRIPKIKGDLNRSFLIQARAASQIWRRLLYFSWEQTVFENWGQSLCQLAEKYGDVEFKNCGNSLRTVAKLVSDCQEKNIPLTDKQRREISTLLDSLEINLSHNLIAEDAHPDHHQDELIHKKTIVIIDDDPMIIEFLHLHLEHAGYSVKGFSNPDEAVEYIREHRPSVVILDIMFPDDDAGGIKTIKKIRDVSDDRIPALFLSAREDFSIRMQVVKADGDAFITKPVDVSRLLDRLQELTGDHTQYDRRVLLIMPESDLRKHYINLLSHEGVSVHFIDAAQETVAELIEYQPDLVVIGEEVDNYNGLQIARMIYQQDAFAGLPIVFVVDEVTQDKREQVYQLNADLIEIDSDDHVMRAFIESRIAQYRKHIAYSEYSVTQSRTSNIMSRNEVMYEISLAIELSRKGNKNYSLAFIEINNLAVLQQRYGMDCSDLVIQDIEKLIADAVQDKGIICRYSDSVYAILLSATDTDDQKQIQEDLFQKLRAYRTSFNSEAVSVDPVMGGIAFWSHISNVNQAIKEVLNACEIAHGKEPQKLHFFDPATVDSADKQRTKEVLEAIKYALAHDSFKLAFQPIMDLHNEGTDKYELLLRMFNKDGEMVPPSEFFSVAMLANMMGAIDRWVIENALKSLSTIPEEMKPPVLFIKISNISLRDDTLLHWLGERISYYGLKGSSLVFEVSERAITRFPQQAQSFKQNIESIGCKLALEHFGTLNSSLRLLEQVRPHYVKIDGSLIRGLGYNRVHQSKVTSITEKAAHYNCQTVAEFVEEATSLPILWKCGVNFVQGHFLQEAAEGMHHGSPVEEEVSRAVF